jgi:hypothetical protein
VGADARRLAADPPNRVGGGDGPVL